MGGPRFSDVLSGESERRTKAAIPVSGFPFGVRHGYDAPCVWVIEANDGKRKAAKHEPLGSVRICRPTLGRLHNIPDEIGNR